MINNERYKNTAETVADRYPRTEKCVNDKYQGEKPYEDAELLDKGILYKILPFAYDDRSLGGWLYNNRYGIIIAFLIYLLLFIVVFVVRYDIITSDGKDTVMVEIPPEMLEMLDDPKLREMLREENMYMAEQIGIMASQPVRNAYVDENNTTLDRNLRDDRNTNSDRLYEEARRVQMEVEANQARYSRGLQALASNPSSRANVERGDNSNVNIGESARSREGNPNSVTKGNVAASYNLAGRSAIYLEIPSYRCAGSGTVTVNITVSENGAVIASSVRGGESISEQCLKDMALEAARNSTFNLSPDGRTQQTGYITFKFVRQ